MKRTVKITSNGRYGGTEVIDVETGNRIPGVARVAFDHDGREMPMAQITIVTPMLEIEGPAEFLFVDADGNELELRPKDDG